MKKLIEKIKENKIKTAIITGVLIIVLVAIGLTINYVHDKKVLKNSSIDLNSETYKGKKVKVKGNQLIIYEENGSKTIETVTKDEEKLTKATESVKDKFKISNISIDKQAAKYSVTGDVKVLSADYSQVVISAKFYRDGNIAATSSKTIKDIEKNKTYGFEMSFVGDYSDCNSKVEVEYVK